MPHSTAVFTQVHESPGCDRWGQTAEPSVLSVLAFESYHQMNGTELRL